MIEPTDLIQPIYPVHCLDLHIGDVIDLMFEAPVVIAAITPDEGWTEYDSVFIITPGNDADPFIISGYVRQIVEGPFLK